MSENKTKELEMTSKDVKPSITKIGPSVPDKVKEDDGDGPN